MTKYVIIISLILIIETADMILNHVNNNTAWCFMRQRQVCTKSHAHTILSIWVNTTIVLTLRQIRTSIANDKNVPTWLLLLFMVHFWTNNLHCVQTNWDYQTYGTTLGLSNLWRTQRWQSIENTIDPAEM